VSVSPALITLDGHRLYRAPIISQRRDFHQTLNPKSCKPQNPGAEIRRECPQTTRPSHSHLTGKSTPADPLRSFGPLHETEIRATSGLSGIGLWPNIVPPSISLWDAAAAPRSQAFLILGTLFLLPVILGYTAWSYWVFRGKVRADTGYH